MKNTEKRMIGRTITTQAKKHGGNDTGIQCTTRQTLSLFFSRKNCTFKVLAFSLFCRCFVPVFILFNKVNK